MTEEQQLLEMIAMIQKDYQKQIEPYIKRLVLIESLKPPPPIFITLEQAMALGLPLSGEQERLTK